MGRMIIAARPAALTVVSRYVREAVRPRRIAPRARRPGDARSQGDRLRPRQSAATDAAGHAAGVRLPRAEGAGPQTQRAQAPGDARHLTRARGAEARSA